MPTPADILKKYWGYSSFRPVQQDIIQSVLDGKDTLALLPTGGGKSVCFQVPALVQEGICIVVSPLIALMKDQVDNLVRRGISATTINSTMSFKEIDIALDSCVYGGIKFLYLSPERLGTELVRERIKKMKVNLLAIDEAHCISQWGHDFRPSYLQIAEIRELIPNTPVLALTASATPETVDDIQFQLLFKHQNVLRQSFARSNLAYVVRYETNKLGKLLEICNSIPGSGLVYVRNRRATKQIADFLIRNKISANHYHAGLNTAERAGVQQRWIDDKTRIIVCTNAFGMGIDKPNVRFVVHMDLPDSPEAYFQEAGRAGRDGQRAFGALLYAESDATEARVKFEKTFPPILEIKRIYKALSNYLSVAEGSGEGATFDFDLNHFCEYYKLDIVVTFSALKLLEKEGYITLTDAVYQPPRLFIPINHEALYNFQVQNPKMDAFIKIILRLYGGVFEQYVNIKEQDIARSGKIKTDEVINLLNLLKKQNIVDYVKATDKPQIIFMRPVVSEKNLFIYEKYHKLKLAYEKRLDAFLSYVQTKNKCRSIMLLEYFGETAAEPCGHCDYCVEKNKVEPAPSEIKILTEKVLIVVDTNNPRPDALIKLMQGEDTDLVKNILATLIEDGHILISPEGKLSVRE